MGPVRWWVKKVSRAREQDQDVVGGRQGRHEWLARHPDGFRPRPWRMPGWDALTVDMQHGMIDYQATVTMLQAISDHRRPTPMVRVPWNDPASS